LNSNFTPSFPPHLLSTPPLTSSHSPPSLPHLPLLICLISTSHFLFSFNIGNPVQNSFIYNDNGRSDDFNYALSNGVYNITIGLGQFGASRNDNSYLEIEGIIVYNGTINGNVVGQIELSRVC
jgi:hypothetical protein